MTQGEKVLNGPAVVTQGATIEVEVLTNASEVRVSTGGPDTSFVPVDSDGKASIPTPPGFTGIIAISIGSGLNRRYHFVEVIAPQP